MAQRVQVMSESRECIERCLSCHRVCTETITHCLKMGGEHAAADHIGLLRDCAAICELSAKFMMHGSQFHHKTCATCAEVCDACAKECDRLARGDRKMQECAEMCRRCAESCRQMAMTAA